MNMTSKNPFRKELEDMLKSKTKDKDKDNKNKNNTINSNLNLTNKSKNKSTDNLLNSNKFNNTCTLNSKSNTTTSINTMKIKINKPNDKPVTSRPSLLKEAKNVDRVNHSTKTINPDKIKSKVENQFRSSR
jgi:hypothetical protein